MEHFWEGPEFGFFEDLPKEVKQKLNKILHPGAGNANSFAWLPSSGEKLLVNSRPNSASSNRSGCLHSVPGLTPTNSNDFTSIQHINTGQNMCPAGRYPSKSATTVCNTPTGQLGSLPSGGVRNAIPSSQSSQHNKDTHGVPNEGQQPLATIGQSTAITPDTVAPPVATHSAGGNQNMQPNITDKRTSNIDGVVSGGDHLSSDASKTHQSTTDWDQNSAGQNTHNNKSTVNDNSKPIQPSTTNQSNKSETTSDSNINPVNSDSQTFNNPNCTEQVEDAQVSDQEYPKIGSGAGTVATCTQDTLSQPLPGNSANPPEKPKVSSWASLFRQPSIETKATVIYSEPVKKEASPVEEEKAEVQNVPVSAAEDRNSRQLGELLVDHSLCHKPISLQPRGLINRANWCYVNAKTLQALLACPPFYHLTKALPSFPALTRGPSSTPVIDSIIQFVNEFTPMHIKAPEKKALNAKGTVFKADLPLGPCFEPSYVYKMLQLMNYNAAFKHGHQEDAEEFLSCVLNGMHDEMVAAINLIQMPSGQGQQHIAESPTANGDCNAVTEEGDEEEEGWEQVGPRNKVVITRTTSFTSSPVSSIFQGQVRSVLHRAGARESATLQPFFTLQLDIHHERVFHVKDALDGLVSKESVEGLTCNKTKMEVEATRRMLLEDLPPVLVLHLKWFVYDKSGGSQKLQKKVEFDVDLDINKELLSPKARSTYPLSQRKYKLFAVVNHHGQRAVGGHYTCDYFHPGLGGWVHADDSIIRPLPVHLLLKFTPPKVPYLLYYRKLELT